jgi:hypothetical protein
MNIPSKADPFWAAQDGSFSWEIRTNFFNKCFHQTVDKLPAGIASQLREHWSKNTIIHTITGVSTPAPVIIVGLHEEGDGPAGTCNRTGTEFIFDAKTMLLAPPWVIEPVVAHELAHVYRILCGADVSHGTPNGITDEYTVAEQVEELAANQLVCLWGFDQFALETWISAIVSFPPDPFLLYSKMRKAVEETLRHDSKQRASLSKVFSFPAAA